jgi:hypothetical protein
MGREMRLPTITITPIHFKKTKRLNIEISTPITAENIIDRMAEFQEMFDQVRRDQESRHVILPPEIAELLRQQEIVSPAFTPWPNQGPNQRIPEAWGNSIATAAEELRRRIDEDILNGIYANQNGSNLYATYATTATDRSI